MKADVVVLGAGIVGLSTAIHLARRGKSVLLVDRRGVGEETSFGNAGLIQREGVVPYGFPHDFGALFRYALNNTIDAHYHVKALPGLVPFLIRYWWNSGFTQHQRIARLYAPLIENSITEHDDLIKASGADNLIQRDGWMKVFRTEKARDEAYREAERLSTGFGVHHQKLSSSEIKTLEPSIRAELAGGLRWTDPWSIRDPHSLNKAYLTYFQSLGGQIVAGDAATLEHVLEGPGWRIASPEGPIEALEVVVALGPWADTVTRKLGYRFPLAVKRGYHMHYGSQEGAQLNNWVLDAEKGYFLAPMLRGIRLTTGAEFATRDAPKTPVQLDRAERVARDFYPLAERRDAEPWMGARPCTPDMMPIIGKAPRHQGLWFAFGHAHHGMTLGPVTGRALAEQMTGARTVVDLAPYRPERFLA
ncbi:NAD(P)/FAD-dependent oxidoreductase [Rhizobium sp. YIM 134829]|uniref:NAD(P)/FAD-dependent oxidoreductase n=1 Tax=Rhizobium sp. YIM 134829 TaxID=3390453 RepID=UPI003977F7EA